MNFLRKIYMALFSPIYRFINSENDKIRLEIEKINGIVNDINNLKKEIESIQGSIHYFSDILAEKSYLIESNTSELKKEKYELKRINIRLMSLFNKDDINRGKIVQVVPVFRTGDAIGDYALFINRVLHMAGFNSEIYSYQNLSNINSIKFVDDLEANEKDVIILHMAAENDFAEIMEAYQSKKVLFYHNITPSAFFHGFDVFAEESTQKGLLQIEKLVAKINYCITDSNYNKQDLRKMGCETEIKVIPIPFEKNRVGDEINFKLNKKLNDGKINLIFVGRIAPNKKIEDIIQCYQNYKDSYNKRTRLILVGSYDSDGKYFQFIKKQIREDDDIIISGHVDTVDWVTYYKNADVFLCMSEHEGFCVPLVEAMYYKIPIVAYDSSAVSETLGQGGILLKEKNFKKFADKIHEVITCQDIKEDIKQKQLLELERFQEEKIGNDIRNCICKIMEG